MLGIVATHHGVTAALCAAAGCLLASMAASLLWPLAATQDGNLEPQAGSRAGPAGPAGGRGGPVVILIEHRVAPEDRAPFLALMKERRRIRLRDGARRWTLLQDLRDPQLWIERYHVPTWMEYLRQKGRRTQFDAANSAALRRLRIGDGEAVIRHMIECRIAALSADSQAASLACPSNDR